MAGYKRNQAHSLSLSFITKFTTIPTHKSKMSKRPRELSLPQVSPAVSRPSGKRDENIEERNGLSKLVRVNSALQQTVIACSEKPLCQSRPFNTYEEYEVHYHQTHINRCIECKKNFPSERFLHLHIQETRKEAHSVLLRHE